jgi:CheY-like chemotaxis protein
MSADVLIVDDDYAMREILASICEIVDIPYRMAFDGIDAQAKIQAEAPALIILDLMMPRLDGHGVLKWLHSNPILSQIPVVIYTAKYLSKEQKASLGLPESMILNKSQLSMEQLQELIASAIPS